MSISVNTFSVKVLIIAVIASIGNK